MRDLNRKISRRRFVQTTVAAGVALYLTSDRLERVDALADLDPEMFVERPFQIALDRQMIPLTWRITLHPDDRYEGPSPPGYVGDGYYASFLGPGGESFRVVFDHRYAPVYGPLGPTIIRPSDVGVLGGSIPLVIAQELRMLPEDRARIRLEDLQIVRNDPILGETSAMWGDDVSPGLPPVLHGLSERTRRVLDL